MYSLYVGRLQRPDVLVHVCCIVRMLFLYPPSIMCVEPKWRCGHTPTSMWGTTTNKVSWFKGVLCRHVPTSGVLMQSGLYPENPDRRTPYEQVSIPVVP